MNGQTVTSDVRVYVREPLVESQLQKCFGSRTNHEEANELIDRAQSRKHVIMVENEVLINATDRISMNSISRHSEYD